MTIVSNDPLKEPGVDVASGSASDYTIVAGECGWADAAADCLRENGFCIVTGAGGCGLAPAEICDRCSKASGAQLSELDRLCQALGLDTRRDKIMYSEICARSPGCLRYDIALPLALGDTRSVQLACSDVDAWAELHSCIDRWARPVLQAFGLFSERDVTTDVGTDGCLEGCDRAGCVISLPGSPDQSFHRDSPPPHNGPAGLVTAFMPLVSVDASNGPTEFTPRSHKHVIGDDMFSDFIASACDEPDPLPVRPMLNKGDLLLFDYDVSHRGLANRSAEPRPVAYKVFNSPGKTDKHNFPSASLRDAARHLSQKQVDVSDSTTDEVPVPTKAPACDIFDVDAAVERLAPYMLPPSYQRILLAMMQATDEVFTAAGIPYWICGGVLIGALRHGGFVPHDDDLDIECYEVDASRIRDACAASSLPVRFELSVEQRSSVMGKLVFFDIKSVQTTIDVFLRERPLQELKEFPSEAEVFPLQRISFNGVHVNGPGGDPGAYLSRCYSSEVFTTARVWNHHVQYLGDVDTEVFVARSWALPLALYNEAVAKLGYQPPEVRATAGETFEHLGREGGEIQTMLWDYLGWASPMLPPPGAEF